MGTQRNIAKLIEQLESCQAVLYTPVSEEGGILIEDQETHILVPQNLHVEIMGIFNEWLSF